MHNQHRFYQQQKGKKQLLKTTKKPEKVINDMTETVAEFQSVSIETIVSLIVRPKPIWLPKFLYLKMVKLVLKVETFKGSINN